MRLKTFLRTIVKYAYLSLKSANCTQDFTEYRNDYKGFI